MNDFAFPFPFPFPLPLIMAFRVMENGSLSAKDDGMVRHLEQLEAWNSGWLVNRIVILFPTTDLQPVQKTRKSSNSVET